MNKVTSYALVCSLSLLTCPGLWAGEFSIAAIGAGKAHDLNSSGKVAASINNVAVTFDGQTATPIVIPQYIQDPWGNWESLYPTAALAISESGWMVVFHEPSNSYFVFNTDTKAWFGYANDTTLNSINSSGKAVGTVDPSVGAPFFQLLGLHAPPYSLISGHGGLNDISDQGVMAGSLSTNSMGLPDPPSRTYWQPRRACLFLDGMPQLVDQRAMPEHWWASELDDWSDATSVNDQLWVAGWQRADFQGNRRAFLHQGSEPLDLGTLGGDESIARDLNDDGVVVGWAHDPAGNKRAFIYRNSIMTDLNSLIPPNSDWVLEEAVAVNNRGQIAGSGTLNGTAQAFLLNPEGLGVPPSITTQPTGGGVMGMGSQLELNVTVSGDAPFSYQWFKDESELADQTANTLTIAELEKSDAGEYWVRISNAYGTTASVRVPVEVPDALLSIATYAGISITGQVGASYRLEYKTDADSNNWHTLSGTIVLTVNPQLFVDTSSPATGQRIYRALQVE